MLFTPKTEKEVSPLFERGDYKFKVIDALEKDDRNGNPMLQVKMQVFHNVIPGKTNIVDLWLTNNPNFEFLIRHFSYSIGLAESYEKGSLSPEQCIDRIGIVRLGISVDKNHKYPDRNKAVDFICEKNEDNVMHDLMTKLHSSHTSNVGDSATTQLNDDLPF